MTHPIVASPDLPLPEPLPLTTAQYGIWLGQQLDPVNPAYWTAEMVELTGMLDCDVFSDAVLQTLAECDSLHMRYQQRGDQLLQWHGPVAAHLTMPLVDISLQQDPWAAALAWAKADLHQQADLAAGPLFRSVLLRLAPDRHLWYLRVHHIALDGFGYTVLTRRVSQRFQAACTGQLPAAVDWSLKRVIDEDLHYQQGDVRQRDLAFWQTTMAEAPAPVLLGPPVPVAHRVHRVHGVLSASEFALWQAAAAAMQMDWTTWCTAGIVAWLYRQTGATDVTLGLPVMGRLGSVTLTIPCMVMNIVPLRIRFDPAQGFAELVQQVDKAMRTLRPHQRYRYEWLRRDLGRVGGQRRLFGPVVNLMPFDRPLTFHGLTAIAHPVSAGPVEDLAINLSPRAGVLRLDIEANPDGYDHATLQQHRASLFATLHDLAGQPVTPLLAWRPAHAQQMVLLQGAPLATAPVQVLSALIAQVQATPDHPAIEQSGVPTLSYRALLHRVQLMAGWLHAQGVGEGARVALLLPRQPDTIVALLAVLWAGGGYVPLDPASPLARIAMVLEDAQPTMVLTQGDYAALVPAHLPCHHLDAMDLVADSTPLATPNPVPANALAYMIYTSGSTGRPNGVMIGRDALSSYVASATQRFDMCAADRTLQFAPLHFDASIEEIFVTLCNGATLVLRTEAMLESMSQFIAGCTQQRISVLDLPTAFWHELVYSLSDKTAALPASLRLTIIGGEAALAERVIRWRTLVSQQVLLLNTYGPTEATVIATTAELAGPNALQWEGDSVPIGEPLPGESAVVVDDMLQPVGRGVAGELCLMGPALALGYWEREAVTARRFITLTALPDQPRAYRTGDRVMVDEQGQLRYLGRLDDEFKLSGHRIDPSEVETALLSHMQIREAAVIGQILPSGSKRLAAFLVGNDIKPDVAQLRTYLAERLPAVAVPTAYQFLDRLPRNANNKIDRHALRALPVETGTSLATQATPLEQAIIAVWQEVLGAVDLTPEADFFMLGGKSLQAIQVATRLQQRLQREVAVSVLFRYPTVAALAQAMTMAPSSLDPSGLADPLAAVLPIQGGDGPVLFCLHPAEGLSWCYFGLGALLPAQRIVGLQAVGLTGALPVTFEQRIDQHVKAIQQIQPTGPYHLLGWSFGGAAAHAVAVALQAKGEQVAMLAILDSYPSEAWSGRPMPTERDALEALLDINGDPAIDEAGVPLTADVIRERLRRPGSLLNGLSESQMARLTEVALHNMTQFRSAITGRFDGDILMFRAMQRRPDAPDIECWKPYVTGMIDRVEVDSTHADMTKPAPLMKISSILNQRMGCK
ncbi:non-ribosomal peptide synthetase [Chitinivorax sp. B]|uniref:non-ribosomal peptide synthetase n=1 Tax=Chitinivorax sp. B TaxID=2502235 RepID=UPI0010F45BDA|nr:non-ribosomal peptide synthetase [Chitinivorax sp. B]